MLVGSYHTSNPGFSERCWSFIKTDPSVKAREKTQQPPYEAGAESVQIGTSEEWGGKGLRAWFACTKERRAVCG